MATQHGHVSLDLLDKLGVTSSMAIYVRADDTKTIAAALTDAASLATAVDGASDSQITGITLKLKAVIPGGVKVAPAATAENERTGLFNLSQPPSPYKFGVDVPSIADSVITAGKIDLSNPAITALVAALTVAFPALAVESTSLYQLVALLDALLTFRKHRKAESRRSFEIG